jgi:thiol-disulfide isomerase/thioredoxin
MRNEALLFIRTWILRSLIGCCWLLIVDHAGARAQSAGNSCEPTPAVKEALKKVSEIDERQLPLVQARARKLEVLRALLKEYPDDLFVHRRYQDTFRYMDLDDPEVLIAQYRAQMEKQPNNPVALYLYARALSGWRTKEAITLLERALQLAPNFAWPHQALAVIYRMPAYRDKAKQQEHAKSFLERCPQSLTAYDFLRQSDDQELLRTQVPKLRALLEKRTDPDDLSHYNTLWQLEFKLRPPAEHAQVRKQIETDLQRLREMNLVKSEQWLDLLRDGYKMINHLEDQRWAEEQMINNHPHSSTAFYYYRQRWDAEHKYPEPDDPPEKRQAYFQALYEASTEWIKRWPENVSTWSSRFYAASSLEKLPQAELEAAVDGFLNTLEKNPGTVYAIPPFKLQVASLYLKRNIRLDRIPALVESGISEVEQREQRREQSDMISPEQKREFGGNLKFVQWMGYSVLVDAYLKLQQPAKAREVLAQMAAALAKERPAESAKNREKIDYAEHQSTYWERMAKLAEAESRKLDALMCYQNALAFRPRRDEKAKQDKPDELADRTQQLWKELGGTEEGWRAWLARSEASKAAIETASMTPWEKQDKPLPDFALADLQGRVWKLADLKGKVSFINLWATWCGPCIQELPHLQKLYEQTKDRKDMLVLTLNVDQEIGLIEPFVKEKKYTFPVLPAYSYVESILPLISIPRNWVVSTDGVIEMEQIGFGGDGEQWLKQALEMIEKVRGGK